jgi:hypothetical protein
MLGVQIVDPDLHRCIRNHLERLAQRLRNALVAAANTG